MKKILLPAIVLLISILSIPGWGRTPASEEAAIRQLDAEWSAALEARDLDRVMTFYAEDASFLVPNQPIIVGAPAIRAWFAERIARPGYRASFVPTEVVVADSLDLAYELGAFRAEVTRDDGATLVSTGKHLVTWKRVGGQWRVAAESISTDAPQPTVVPSR
jgi:uncharacterized protein (TIGR02246 family)